MSYSKYDNELTFTETEWVVSLINTKKGISSIFGGHAKIVVEGLIRKSGSQFPVLFLGEYHIMEAERVPEETWIPQCFRNTQCKYLVLFKEVNKYSRKDEEYAEIQSRSHGGIVPQEAFKMIKSIKDQQAAIKLGFDSPDFQYAGKWCFYGLNDAHNCTTWAEEKLDMIGIGKHLITDSTKAMPFLHVNAPDSSSVCNII